MLVQADSISKDYPAGRGREVITVLNDITLQVGEGEFVSIVGPSGSGKSTLLYCLGGLERVSAGTVSLTGIDLTQLRAAAIAKLRRDQVGFIFQSCNLIPALDVRENVELQARLAGREVSKREIDAVLLDVGLEGLHEARPERLSGGQQQRVAVARALLSRPRILFADEPTGALDAVAGAGVMGLLRRVADGRRSVVVVTHDPEAAARTDRVLVLRGGQLHRELIRPSARQVFEAVERAA